MIEILSGLFERYRRKGILVDSSLLVVYLIGRFDRKQLANCRAIKSSFTFKEYDLLASFIGQCEPLITTPHVLTEVSNLAGKLPTSLHHRFRKFFRQVIEALFEERIPAVEIASDDTFIKFGLADSAIAKIAPGRYLILTEDAALSGFLHRKGVDVINFSHYRIAA